jgi:hypothetical protein
MSLEERTYELPFETEDSFRIKMEEGKIKKIEPSEEDEWIPEIYWEEE